MATVTRLTARLKNPDLLFCCVVAGGVAAEVMNANGIEVEEPPWAGDDADETAETRLGPLDLTAGPDAQVTFSSRADASDEEAAKARDIIEKIKATLDEVGACEETSLEV